MSRLTDHPSAPAPMSTRVWTILELIRWTTGYLKEKGLEEPRLDAEVLLADALGIKRLDLYLQFERPLEPDELAAFKARLRRRARREPLQYIAGVAEFRNLRLRVDPRVLIPRPETEVLVEEVLRRTAGRSGLRALDVGTGSGAIALSLATEGGFSSVVGTDISAAALEVARENATTLGIGVELRAGPGYEPVAGERFHVIVSNPPYIGESERGTLEPEVVDWEPSTALFADGDGLAVVRELIRGAPDHLSPGGLVALEIGAGQADAVCRLVRSRAVYRDPEVVRDLAGRDRIVIAELEEE